MLNGIWDKKGDAWGEKSMLKFAIQDKNEDVQSDIETFMKMFAQNYS